MQLIALPDDGVITPEGHPGPVVGHNDLWEAGVTTESDHGLLKVQARDDEGVKNTLLVVFQVHRGHRKVDTLKRKIVTC